MAITVIGGLTVSTLLTLVVIPVMYKLLDRSSDASWKAEGERNKQIGLIGKLVGESQP
jgi:HAE1 family hydrophobic/amphiphilic exporter-1